jgi:hypothetical protein
MKKIIYFYVLVLTSISVRAQESGQQKKHLEIGLSVMSVDKVPSLGGLNNISDNRYFSSGERRNKSFGMALNCNYYFNNYYSLRFQAGLSLNRIIENAQYTVIQNTQTYDSLSVKNNNFRFSTGIFAQQSFDRLVFFGGVSLPIVFYGANEILSSSRTLTIPSDTIYDAVRSEIQTSIGFSGGLCFGLGASLTLSPKFSIIGTTDFGFFYSLFNGKTTSTTTSDIRTTQTYPPTVVSRSYTENLSALFSPRHFFSITIAYKVSH